MERQRKRQLRELNAKTWAGETEVYPVQKSLDSKLNKNTAFIRRLRTSINPQSLNAFLLEVRTLSLQKYLSEIISACFEGLCKLKAPGDIAVGVEVVSALHQRFGAADFTGYLGWMIGRGLSTPDKSQLKSLPQDVREREEKERVSRQKILLRIATELWLVGVLRSLEDIVRPDEAGRAKEGAKVAEPSAKSRNGSRASEDAEPFPLEVLKDLLGHDREHTNLPLVTNFVKTFSWDVLGVKSAEEPKIVSGNGTSMEEQSDGSTGEESAETVNEEPLVQPELRQLFRNVFLRYFEDLKTHVTRDQKNIVSQGKRNAEAYVRSGEVFEDRQANYEKQVKAQEKLVANAQIMADALGAEMPSLKEKESSAINGDGGIGLVKAGEYLRGQSEGAGIWEDEDERRFYENLLDLKDRVPGILLEDKKKKVDGEDQIGKRSDVPAEPEKPGEADDASIAIANKSVGAQVDALLARLPEMTNKDMVDQAAMDFCFLNSKASRNRLIKAVEEIPKGRTDLLPYYARLVATLGKYMPDISQALVTYLDDEFRSLQRRKTKEFLGQVRLQNVRYLAELTKFGVVPEHVIFHCLKLSLEEFSRMNIEIMSSLLENSGRYLLRNPETSPRMSSFLETLNRKKGAQHLGQQERMLLENAMYYVNPPERGTIEQKERSPIDMFVRKLIYLDLKRSNVDKIAKLIRKLHWEDDEVVTVLFRVFTKPSKVKHAHIEYLADVLGAMRKHHFDFVVSVVDCMVESITYGLELNDFRFNQRRVAEVIYLAELYCMQVLDSKLLFDTLYKIITYGYEGGVPKPGAFNPLDAPDEYFRIRLVCELLLVLSDLEHIFDRGPAKKKLDFFLTFFQYYAAIKEPLPMDSGYLISETYGKIRPSWKVNTDLDEAGKIFADAVRLNYQTAAADKAEEEAEAEEDSDSDDDNEDSKTRRVDIKSSGDESEELTNGLETPDAASADEEEEHIVVTRPEDDVDPEADADFEREYQKMMAESVESRKHERRTMFDVPLPMRRRADNSIDGETEPTAEEPPSTMKFSLLSKRGARQQTRAIDLPADSTFAVAMRNQQQAETEEKQRIKNLVLNYDLTSEEDPNGEYDDLSLPPLQLNLNRPELYGKNGAGMQPPTLPEQQNLRLSSTKPPASNSYVSQVSRLRQNISGSNVRQSSTRKQSTKTEENSAKSRIQPGIEKQPQNPYAAPRIDKASNNARMQRGRKLQLSDMDWQVDDFPKLEKPRRDALAANGRAKTTNPQTRTEGMGRGRGGG